MKWDGYILCIRSPREINMRLSRLDVSNLVLAIDECRIAAGDGDGDGAGAWNPFAYGSTTS